MEDEDNNAFPIWTQVCPDEKTVTTPICTSLVPIESENLTILLERRKNGQLIPAGSAPEKPARAKRKAPVPLFQPSRAQESRITQESRFHVQESYFHGQEPLSLPPMSPLTSFHQPALLSPMSSRAEPTTCQTQSSLQQLPLLPALRSLCLQLEQLNRRQMMVFLDDDQEFRAFSSLTCISGCSSPNVTQFCAAQKAHGWNASDLVSNVFYCGWTVHGNVQVLPFQPLLTRNKTLANHLVLFTHWYLKSCSLH